MAGKVAASHKDKQYRNYWCSRATKSRAMCAHYNGHSAPKLETAVLDYLGQFSDPEMVERHIEAADLEELSTRESELMAIESGLKELDAAVHSEPGLPEARDIEREGVRQGQRYGP